MHHLHAPQVDDGDSAIKTASAFRAIHMQSDSFRYR